MASSQNEHEDERQRELSALRARVCALEDGARSAERDLVRYRLLLEHLNVGVFVSSLDGRMLECNDRTVQMSGETRESLLTKDLSTHYENPEDRARLVAELRSTGRVRNFETWTRQRDGKRQAVSMNAVLAPIGPEGSMLILGMLEDITDRKLAEERAGEGEERFRVLAEQSMLGIAIMQDSALRFVNQAVADMNGYSIEEMSDWNVIDFGKLIHPDDLAFATEQARKKQAGDPSALTHYSYRILTKSGEIRWVEQYSRSIEYGGRPANFITIIDITARKQAEATLSQLSLSMERAAKLESLGVLAAGIAHDFNNLLGGLFGHLELARSTLDDNGAARAHLDLAQQAFERAKGLTTQLLAFAKGGTPVRKAGSLAACVKRCSDFALSGSNVKVELELGPELWSAEFDENQLAQAFDNILINAKQAMPAGGFLRVTGRNVDAQQGPALELAPGRYVRLSFCDQGPGIPETIVERIFDPFFTTKAEGSGIGLTAAYAILKKHDGHIEVESRLGVGTTFHVWLPASLERAGKAQAPPPEAHVGQGLVLVMDDDDMVRQVASGMLAHLGYEPIPTCDGGEAVERTRGLLAEGKQLCAALLDLTVRAGAGGRETVAPLRALVPKLPIIASSGYSDDPVMADPEQFGFSASLRKPFRLSELVELLERLAAQGR
ncbi:MAG TPA: PAS domain S-box protein [Polyangiaceae bacterium]|nr:PAS domain S-box protein [Polyangiaceae bacterium]